MSQDSGFIPPFFDIIRVGNVGTRIDVSLKKVDNSGPSPVLVPVDLTNGKPQIDLRKPSGKVIETTAIITNPPGTDGEMFVIDTVGVFDKRGRWACRGALFMSNDNIFKGSWDGFPVDE